MVSIHAPAWGATPDVFNRSTRFIMFQSTRPRGARQFGALDVGVHEVFQSTRPRGARRFLLQRRYILAGSFNPRARVGRDPGIDCSGIKVIGFQSTRPRGARRQTLAFGKVASAVSIHAPAWGATFRYVFPLCNLGQFQSTRPRGARREIGGAFQGAPGFNPRARVGRDATRTGERPVLVWFQSTRPRGARHQFFDFVDCVHKVSIHAPAWGATSSS